MNIGDLVNNFQYYHPLKKEVIDFSKMSNKDRSWLMELRAWCLNALDLLPFLKASHEITHDTSGFEAYRLYLELLQNKVREVLKSELPDAIEEDLSIKEHLSDLDTLALNLDHLMVQALGPEHAWTASYVVDSPLNPEGAYVFNGRQVQQLAEIREELNSILMYFEENKYKLVRE